ncbi:MAG TPA: GNAT family N-acetyltransferase [Tepidisphaeraceae bacterium]|nr:GNAT family N-acetyltransferase [Tepidisphaeraceae bacterium]
MRPIATKRLVVREFEVADSDAVARMLDDCFGPMPRVEREAWLDWTVRNYRALEQLGQPPYGDYAVALRDSGDVIGSVGLVPSFGPFDTLPTLSARLRAKPTGRHRPEMGLFWAVAGPHRGSGYATEAAAALAEFAFNSLNVDRLVATTEHDNDASIRVMRRLGMTVERNAQPEPAWFQTVGVLFNPGR